MTTLSARLRRERERQGITLDSIAATTKISASLFAGLERGDVSRWPSGIFRRSFIRAYATAIGLDPEAVCREFTEQVPEADTDRRRIVTQPDRHPSRREAGPVAVDHRPVSPLRLTLHEAGGSRSLWNRLLLSWRRWTAAACDFGAVATLAVAGYMVAGQFWISLALSAVFYYGASALLLGSTPGVSWLISRHRETLAAPAHITLRPHVVDTRIDETVEADDEAVLVQPVTAPKLHRVARIDRSGSGRARA
jgi:transcriptional regulator with XRE-family HTH domain